MSAQVAADLRAAADVLERDGWRQHGYGYPGTCKCLYGALHYVATDGQYTGDDALSNAEEGRVTDAADVVRGSLSGTYLDLVDWNDTEGRTADEVIAALRAAADRAEASDA